MFFRQVFLATLLTGIALASSSTDDTAERMPLCIRGCCGLSLKLDSNQLSFHSISSGTDDQPNLTVPAPNNRIDCCPCEPPVKPCIGKLCPLPPTFPPDGFCPPGCPAPCTNCRAVSFGMRYLQSLENSTNGPVMCPADVCEPHCVCRKEFMASLNKILFPTLAKAPTDRPSKDEL